MEILRKLKMELLYDPAIPLLGLYPEERKYNPEEIYAPTPTAALLTIATREKLPK